MRLLLACASSLQARLVQMSAQTAPRPGLRGRGAQPHGYALSDGKISLQMSVTGQGQDARPSLSDDQAMFLLAVHSPANQCASAACREELA